MVGNRWSRLFGEMEGAGVSNVAIMPGANMFYMTGLRMGLSERPTVLLISKKRTASFVMPKLEVQKGINAARRLQEEGLDFHVNVESYSDDEGPSPAFRRAVKETAEGAWGLENRTMRLLEYSLMKDALGEIAWLDAGIIMRNLRMVKDEVELRLMKQACALADLGVDMARKLLAPGKVASDIAALIEQRLKQEGAQSASMALATGADTAIPHAGVSRKPVKEGDLAWLDLVVNVGGYYGDITRSYGVGALSPELDRIYRVVLEAQENARVNAKPGMTGAEVDALSRDVIESYGYGEYFTHRTGHGLGLEVHEEPYIVSSNHEPLPEGSTFTIEPGIYLPGKGGVRIEDDVLMTKEGLVSLTKYPRNLLDERLVV